jgi:putative aldouronate transport system substrate-binding protein
MSGVKIDRRQMLYGSAALVGAAALAACSSSGDDNESAEPPGGGATSAGGGGSTSGSSGGGGVVDDWFFKAPELPVEDDVPTAKRNLTVEQFTAPVADKYDPPITISTVTQSNPSVKLPSGSSWTGSSPFIEAYQRMYGINVKTLWAVDSTQMQQKVNLMIASGSLPDYFLASALQLDQLVKADKVQDMTEVYRQHASDLLRGVILEAGPIALKSATYDGHLMAVPFSGNPEEATQTLMLRKDWLDKLGLSEPKSMDDVLAVAKAFATGNPSGKGQTGYGLVLDKTLLYAQGFMNGYHAYRDIWVPGSGGDLVYGSVQPEMKEALSKLQELYKAKYIDPEFGVKDFTAGGKIEADLIAERQGMFFSAGAGYWLNTLKENNHATDFISLPLPSVDSTPAKAQVASPGTNGYWVVRKGYEHPEAVLKIIEFFVQSFYYVPSQPVLNAFVTNTELDSPVYTLNKGATYRAFENIDHWKSITDLIDKGGANPDVGKLRPVSVNMYKDVKAYLDGDLKYYYWPVGLYGPTATRAAQNYYRTNDLYMKNQFYGVPTTTMSSRQALLQTMEDQAFTEIIRGKGIDQFDTFVKNWKSQGGDQITKEVNDWQQAQSS